MHRGIEKLAGTKNVYRDNSLRTGWTYLSSMSNNLAHCLAVEKLAGIEVPERAEIYKSDHVRASEGGSHLIAIGDF